MQRTPTTKRVTRHAESLPSCLRQCLTPAVWKQAQRGLRKPRSDARWGFHHLVLVLLAMTWSLGDSTPERFEMARGIVAICRPKRRRAGQTSQGFQKALGRLPMRPLNALAEAVRRRLLVLLGEVLTVDGFIPLGCDGSRLECVRNDELLARVGRANKPNAPPSLWVTALVHLSTGVPWAWRLGTANANERGHLRAMIPCLPATALVVADAGYVGYDLATTLAAANVSFLIRVSSVVRLLTDQPTARSRFEQGEVWYWPQEAQRQRLQPLRLRLIRVRGRRVGRSGRTKTDVWLLSNVMDPARLSITEAARFYRLRWENEGLFRTYKRTLKKVHLVGRTVRTVHREAFGSLLACQVLLIQGAWALSRKAVRPAVGEICSARQAILAVRQELLAAMRPDHRRSYLDRLEGCVRERRQRTSLKQKREWPQRTPHKPPKPPRLLTMSEKQKALLSRVNATQ